MVGSDIVEKYNLKIVANHASENIPHPAALHKTSYKSGKLEGAGSKICAMCRPIMQIKLRPGMNLQNNDLLENIDAVFDCVVQIRRNRIIDAKIDTMQQYATCSRSTCKSGHKLQTHTKLNHSTKMGSSQKTSEQGANAKSILFS